MEKLKFGMFGVEIVEVLLPFAPFKALVIGGVPVQPQKYHQQNDGSHGYRDGMDVHHRHQHHADGRGDDRYRSPAPCFALALAWWCRYLLWPRRKRWKISAGRPVDEGMRNEVYVKQ